MIKHQTQIRVRYAETDQMGFVYYGNYSTYFEVARVELLRSIGLNYKDLELDGVALPVSSYSIQYLKPAFYDDLLNVTTKVAEMSGARIRFEYETRNQSGDLLNTAETTLVFVNKLTLKPCQPPQSVTELFEKHISNDL